MKELEKIYKKIVNAAKKDSLESLIQIEKAFNKILRKKVMSKTDFTNAYHLLVSSGYAGRDCIDEGVNEDHVFKKNLAMVEKLSARS